MIAFTLDGQPCVAHEGETLFDAARRHGTTIPHLCHREGLRADGNCRACVVEVQGERTLTASCCRAAEPSGARRLVGSRATANLPTGERPR